MPCRRLRTFYLFDNQIKDDDAAVLAVPCPSERQGLEARLTREVTSSIPSLPLGQAFHPMSAWPRSSLHLAVRRLCAKHSYFGWALSF